MLSTRYVFLLSSCPSPLSSYALECELGDSEKCKYVSQDILLATTRFIWLQLFPKSSSGLTVRKSSDFRLEMLDLSPVQSECLYPTALLLSPQ